MNDEEVEPINVLSNPGETPSLEVTDSIIGKQLGELSLTQREEVLYDVHGISDEVEEGEELITQSLLEMEVQIQKLDDRGPAYDMALEMDRDHVMDRDFRLQFLRADKFDCQQAALRFVRHYQLKLELFGKEKLVKTIDQDDLDDTTLGILYGGQAHILPVRDRAGRVVSVWIPKPMQTTNEVESIAKLKRFFYSSMVLAEDEEAQRKGAVAIVLAVGRKSYTREATHKIIRLLMGLPLRVRAMHVCYDSISWAPFLALLRMAAALFIRFRFRSHFGNQEECLFALQTFGIPVDVFPTVSKRGKISTERTDAMWRKRREAERKRRSENRASFKPSEYVLVPRRNDVLLGRGKGNHQYVGNVRYRNIIEWQYKEEYDKAEKKAEKKEIMKEIVACIHKANGRFLQEDESGWVEVPYDVAVQKVSHTVRTMRRDRLRQQSNNDDCDRGDSQATKRCLESSDGDATRQKIDDDADPPSLI